MFAVSGRFHMNHSEYVVIVRVKEFYVVLKYFVSELSFRWRFEDGVVYLLSLEEGFLERSVGSVINIVIDIVISIVIIITTSITCIVQLESVCVFN